MDIRRYIFTILLAALIYQGNVFAIEEDSNETEELAQLVEDDKWGEPNNGLATQLISQNEEYTVGKPMKFGLVLKNIRDSVKQFDRQEAIACCGLLMVKSADNNELYDKRGPYQTQGAPQPIEAGEIVTLFENRDIIDEYVIIKSGKYTIQFRGGGEFPPSNIIEFEVKPGTPDERDFLIASLIDIFPDTKWRATVTKRRFSPAGRKEESNLVILNRGFMETGSVRVMLWQTKSPAEVIDEWDNRKSDYLGKNASGYFYIEIPSKALDYWPKIKEDIAKSLKLDSSSNDGH